MGVQIPMKVGHSISFCIGDICKEEVLINEVNHIEGNTSVVDPQVRENWQKVIDQYKKVYWKDFPEKAEEVFNRLFQEGRILQRFPGKEHLSGEDWKKWD